MIYHLNELIGHIGNTEWRNDSEKAESIALMLFGIAERLDALIESQKPRWVELIMVDGKKITIPISPFFPIAVSEHNGIEGIENTVLLQTHADNHLIDGTYAEVMAKLRDEVTK